LAVAGLLSLFAAFVVLSCALFVWPAAGRPQRVDAVLSLDGDGELARERTAVALVEAGYAHTLLFSRGFYPNVACPAVPRVRVVCFKPVPGRTVGEVEFAVDYAERHGWHSLMVVSGHSQATRARLLMHRCFRGRTVVVPAPSPSLFDLAYEVGYEWGALLKALAMDRGC
jgi:hypothetical protein